MFQILFAAALFMLLVTVLRQGYETWKKFPSLKDWALVMTVVYGCLTALLVTMIFTVERPDHQSILERFTQSGATVIFILASMLMLIGISDKRKRA